MNTVKILVHKELATTFNSWSIYIGYTLFFCVCGFFSWLSSNNLLYIGQANMMQVFGIINWTQFFLIPALTMKSIADEKRNGTIELMLTKPIKTADLLCSKFFSNLIITTLALALTLPYYITLSFLGEVDHGAVPFRLSGPDRDECMLYLYRHLLLFLVPYCRIGFFHQPRYRFVFPIFIRHVC